jgi:hypothetical protein
VKNESRILVGEIPYESEKVRNKLPGVVVKVPTNFIKVSPSRESINEDGLDDFLEAVVKHANKVGFKHLQEVIQSGKLEFSGKDPLYLIRGKIGSIEVTKNLGMEFLARNNYWGGHYIEIKLKDLSSLKPVDSAKTIRVWKVRDETVKNNLIHDTNMFISEKNNYTIKAYWFDSSDNPQPSNLFAHRAYVKNNNSPVYIIDINSKAGKEFVDHFGIEPLSIFKKKARKRGPGSGSKIPKGKVRFTRSFIDIPINFFADDIYNEANFPWSSTFWIPFKDRQELLRSRYLGDYTVLMPTKSQEAEVAKLFRPYKGNEIIFKKAIEFTHRLLEFSNFNKCSVVNVRRIFEDNNLYQNCLDWQWLRTFGVERCETAGIQERNKVSKRLQKFLYERTRKAYTYNDRHKSLTIKKSKEFMDRVSKINKCIKHLIRELRYVDKQDKYDMAMIVDAIVPLDDYFPEEILYYWLLYL